MSKHETWRTRKYWQRVGGILIEEFIVVKGNQTQGRRLIDGLIVLNEAKGIYDKRSFDITGKDVIVIQTKKGRIGMYLLEQAYFSKLLVEKHQPESIKTVAICDLNDVIMQQLASLHNIEIVVMSDEEE